MRRVMQILRIVVAAPRDVQAERNSLTAVVEELNRGIAADRGLRLEVSHWETSAFPGFHPQGVQGLIDPILGIPDCDLLIGIFWKRFDTPASGANRDTERDFRVAYDAWKRQGRPQIMVYFNQKAYNPTTKVEAEQWGKVLEFRENFPREGLWWPYSGKASFQQLLRSHLTQWILQWTPFSPPPEAPDRSGDTVAAETVGASAATPGEPAGGEAEPRKKTLVWLHLSDLHTCKPKTGWDARRVLRTLRDDLEYMETEHGLTPDLIFFTGDAAFGHIGSGPGETLADQFQDAQLFFESVRTAFGSPVPQDRVFIVPGNHDIHRDLVTPEQTHWLDTAADLDAVIDMIHRAGRQWRQYMERLEHYREFLKTSGYEHLLQDPDRLIYAQVRPINGIPVGIAGFNSAWSCCRNGEKSKLWLGGRWQIEHLLSQIDEAVFSIALIHHPANWFVEQEDPQIWRDIERDFTFCLHGHEHQGWVDAKVDGHTRIAAAACYDSSYNENGYNFVRLDLETGQGEVWLRRYDRGGGGWVPRVIHRRTNNDGKWPLDHMRWGQRLSRRQAR